MVDAAIPSLRSTRESGEDLKWKVPIACEPYPRVVGAGNLDLKLSYMALLRLICADR